MIPFRFKKKYKCSIRRLTFKLKSVLASGWYILGNEVTEFEMQFTWMCHAKYCIGVGNGFDALVLIFKGYTFR
jgi:dTDP-4-amino-4,6-dideoxygalactose transaminase